MFIFIFGRQPESKQPVQKLFQSSDRARHSEDYVWRTARRIKTIKSNYHGAMETGYTRCQGQKLIINYLVMPCEESEQTWWCREPVPELSFTKNKRRTSLTHACHSTILKIELDLFKSGICSVIFLFPISCILASNAASIITRLNTRNIVKNRECYQPWFIPLIHTKWNRLTWNSSLIWIFTDISRLSLK